MLPLATEEFLRFYPPARAHKRIVAVDTEFGGVTMKAGDEVLLSEVAAGRDESEFPDADTFVIDRNPNRHVSFGVGIHRCPGSHLARITFSEMISGVLERMPDYHIDPDAVVDYPDWAMVGGWQRMPATFTPDHPLTRWSTSRSTDEQEQLVEAFRVFFAKECPPTVVRDAEETGGFDPNLWRSAVGARWTDDGCCRRAGRRWRELLDLELAAERAGAALAPVPLVDGWVAARLFAASGDSRAGRARPVSAAERRRSPSSRCSPRATAVVRLVPGGAVADGRGRASTTTSSSWSKPSPTARHARTISARRRSPTGRCAWARARCSHAVTTRACCTSARSTSGGC